MAQLVASSNGNIQAKLNELHTLNMYNLATGKLKKKYVSKPKQLSVLERIRQDFKQLNS